MFKYLLVTVTFLIGSFSLLAQTGDPFIQSFPPAAYQNNAYISSPQNWGVMQDNRGILYVSNTSGVLEYDGITWRLVQGTGYEGRFQFAKNSEGRVFVGSTNNFGYLAPDTLGNMRFVSLLPHLQGKYPGLKVVKLAALGRDVYFSNGERIFRWSGRHFKAWGSKAGFGRIFTVRNQLYALDKEKGLCVLENEQFKALPGTEGFDTLNVTALLPLPASKASRHNFFMATFEQGLFLYKDHILHKLAPRPADALEQEYFMHGIALADGTIALATITRGVVIVNYKGEVKKIINKESGLNDNAVLHLYQDQEGGLWASLNKGVSRISYPSPVSYLGEATGLDGIVLSILKKDKLLYAGTSSGLYVATEDALTPTFEEITPLQNEVWKLLDLGDALLVVSTPGVYVLAKGALQRVSPPENGTVYKTILRSRRDSSRFFVGSSDGLAVLTHQEDGWKWEGKVKGVAHRVIWLAEDKAGTLWASCEDNISAIKASPAAIMQAPVFNYKPSAQLAQRLRRLEAHSINGKVYFGTSEGIYSLQQRGSRLLLAPDSTFGVSFANDTREAINLTEDRHKRIWLSSEFKTGPLHGHPDNTYTWDTIPLSRMPQVDVWTIHTDPKGVVWLGTTEGIFRYDSRVSKNYDTRPHTVLRKVKLSGDSTVFLGAFAGGGAPCLTQSPRFRFTLPHEVSSISFEFAATSYEAPTQLLYSYKLEGEDKDWSHWTTETKKEYTGLDEGNYVFRVKAKNVYGAESLASTFSFSSLPPLYRTWWAYAFYGLCLIAGIVAVDRYQRRRLLYRERKKARERELEQAREIEKAYHELQQTQNRLVQKEKMASLGELTAGIAHEIQNPLNFVNNFSELSFGLVEELWAGPLLQLPPETRAETAEILESLHQNLQKIHHHGRRADAIVKNMLQHSRASSGQREWTNLNALVEEYLRLAYIAVKGKDKHFECLLDTHLDLQLEKVEVMPQEMGQVLLNLYNNAFYSVQQKQRQGVADYAPRVMVTTGSQNGKVEIRVWDNGTGIPPHVQGKIFQPFFTTKPSGQGTGLGLSLSYDIVTKGHGGELSVTTEAGEWTEFVVTLPYVPESTALTKTSTAPATALP